MWGGVYYFLFKFEFTWYIIMLQLIDKHLNCPYYRLSLFRIVSPPFVKIMLRPRWLVGFAQNVLCTRDDICLFTATHYCVLVAIRIWLLLQLLLLVTNRRNSSEIPHFKRSGSTRSVLFPIFRPFVLRYIKLKLTVVVTYSWQRQASYVTDVTCARLWFKYGARQGEGVACVRLRACLALEPGGASRVHGSTQRSI